MSNKLFDFLSRKIQVGRLVLENVLVGTLMGAFVGVALKGYLQHIANLDLIWVMFLLMGLIIGLLSGFARQNRMRYQAIGEKLTATLRDSEKKLVNTEERYKNLLDQANDVIFLLDSQSLFVETNNKFEEILGYKSNEWIGRSLYDLITPNVRDEAIKYCWETLKGGSPRFDLEAICADGRIIDLALANSPVRNSDGEITGIMGIARDISESKKIEELQNKFVSHVSHELRTPLTAMREFIALLIDGIPGKLNEEQTEYCTRVRFNIDRLTRIIENLLLVSSADEGKITLEKKLVNLQDLIIQVRDNLKFTAQKKKIRLKTVLADTFPSIYADPDQIIQVLTNLVGNAIKFTPEGGEISIGAQDQEKNVLLWVQDTGIGISPQDQERIFDRFQQIRQSETFGRQGTGLGLAISREIVGLHRGEIWVESQLGAGSKFIISLPKALAPRVLLVDDDPDLVEMYKDFLEPLHYRLSIAYNGEEAVMKAFQDAPDLIILDIVMPKMSGYEVLGRLRQNKQTCNIPVIILTGYGLDQDRLDNLGEDMLPTLRKPVSMNEFVAAATGVLEKDKASVPGRGAEVTKAESV